MGGMPSAATIRSIDAPEMVKLVKDRIRQLVKGKKVAMGIDGGSSSLAQGKKVVVVTIMSPQLEHDLVLDFDMLSRHEDATTQAAFIARVCDEYGIEPCNLIYVAADNASVNDATVNKLNDMGKGFNVERVRCLPHCLNLVVQAFLRPFEEEYKLTSLFKDVRAFIKAGGGNGRRGFLAEYGVNLSGIDFSDKRLDGFVRAITYMMGMQTDVEMKSADARLAELAGTGDGDAEEAIGGDKVLHYNAIFMAIEELIRRTKGASHDSIVFHFFLCIE